MRSPSASLALDLVFPPEECIHEEEADRYVRHGFTAEALEYNSGYVPALALGAYQAQQQAAAG